jgi:hypothetical protein
LLELNILIPVKCGKDWALYKHKCVKYFNQAVKFQEAEEICESNNATLISIHSAEENEFIRSYVQNQPLSSTRVWIGLIKNVSDEFSWVDKSPVVYVNWDLGQPDNFGGSERYAQMLIDINGKWNDMFDYNYPFVCGFNSK